MVLTRWLHLEFVKLLSFLVHQAKLYICVIFFYLEDNTFPSLMGVLGISLLMK